MMGRRDGPDAQKASNETSFGSNSHACCLQRRPNVKVESACVRNVCWEIYSVKLGSSEALSGWCAAGTYTAFPDAEEG